MGPFLRDFPHNSALFALVSCSDRPLLGVAGWNSFGIWDLVVFGSVCGCRDVP